MILVTYEYVVHQKNCVNYEGHHDWQKGKELVELALLITKVRFGLLLYPWWQFIITSITLGCFFIICFCRSRRRHLIVPITATVARIRCVLIFLVSCVLYYT